MIYKLTKFSSTLDLPPEPPTPTKLAISSLGTSKISRYPNPAKREMDANFSRKTRAKTNLKKDKEEKAGGGL